VQILSHLYQVGGSLNGVTWTGTDASYEDCNTYILDTGRGLILFDCGNGRTLAQIFDNMSYWNLAPDDIRVCLLTHSHLDHAGAAYLLARRGVRLIAHEKTSEAVAAGDERCCGYLYNQPFTPCGSVETCVDGQVLDLCGLAVTAMHLPGHTAGCTVFSFRHEGRVVAVSGDVIGTLLDGYFGWNGSIDFDKAAYLRSLQRFALFDSDIMLPGHGMIYFHAPRRRVEQAFNQALCQWR
jgi:glyoxylase-like metal-dependent hydrolase (beta-lactamase superfamily II)